MYCKHFAFSEDPFSVSPDLRFFYQVDQHGEAVATLYYAMSQRRGFGLLVGRPGVGKTSVLAQLARLLEGIAEVALLPQPYFDRVNLIESILIALDIEPRATPAQNHRLFNQHLLQTEASGKTCVLIFDEAQNLSLETLEAIRMLSNFETSSRKLVQIILSGQPRLAEMLRNAASEQIRQRINVVSRLYPLASYEVGDYIAHRLQVVGSSFKVFTPEALRAIVAGSGGVPRNVNTICFNALSLAYALDRSQVGSAEVAEAIRDLSLASEDVLLPEAPVAQPPIVPRQNNFVVHDGARRGPQPAYDRVLTALRRKVSNQ